jgi:hypothetical protein
MKSFTNRFAIFAASAVVLGTMAYGQTTMKADIPFAFHTSNATLPAGTYTVNQVSGASSINTIRLFDTATHRSVLTVSLPPDVSRTAPEKPSMVFACGEQGCTLREIKTANGTFSYPSGHKAARDREALSMVQIPLTPRNAD